MEPTIDCYTPLAHDLPTRQLKKGAQEYWSELVRIDARKGSATRGLANIKEPFSIEHDLLADLNNTF